MPFFFNIRQHGYPIRAIETSEKPLECMPVPVCRNISGYIGADYAGRNMTDALEEVFFGHSSLIPCCPDNLGLEHILVYREINRAADLIDITIEYISYGYPGGYRLNVNATHEMHQLTDRPQAKIPDLAGSDNREPVLNYVHPCYILRGNTEYCDTRYIRQSACVIYPGAAVDAEREKHIVRMVVKDDNSEVCAAGILYQRVAYMMKVPAADKEDFMAVKKPFHCCFKIGHIPETCTITYVFFIGTEINPVHYVRRGNRTVKIKAQGLLVKRAVFTIVFRWLFFHKGFC